MHCQAERGHDTAHRLTLEEILCRHKHMAPEGNAARVAARIWLGKLIPAGVGPGLQNRCLALRVKGGFDSH